MANDRHFDGDEFYKENTRDPRYRSNFARRERNEKYFGENEDDALFYKTRENEEKLRIKTRDDVIRFFPHYMMLPIPGFKNPKYHLFVATDSVVDLLKNSDAISNIMLAGTTFLNTVRIAGKATELMKEDPEYGDMINDTDYTDYSDYAKFFWRLYSAFGSSKVIMRRLGYLQMIHFYGLQPEFGGRGFTEFVDNKISSYRAREFHRVLNLNEFIIFNHMVHSVEDGEVVDICNDFDDKIRYTTEIRFNDLDPFEKVNPYMGNRIVIKHTALIYSTYANIRKDSFMVRVGDKVKRGQPICKVGCSGTFKSPMLLFGLGGKPSTLFGIRNIRIPFNAIPNLWAQHYSSNLLETENYYGKKSEEFFSHYDSWRITYKPNGTILRDCSFVKQYKTILME